MKKPYVLLTLAWLAYCTGINAQITVTSSVFPVVGDTLHYLIGNQPGAINQIFTPPGGGQTWDLSNLQPTQVWNQIMKDPQTGTAAASFPGASVLFNPVNSSSEVYWQVTGTQVLDMGYYGLDQLGLGLTLLFDNSPGLEVSWAPANFFDIHQSSANVLIAFDAPLAPPVLQNLAPIADSFRIRITYQRISTIDAWGTLAIPGGSFDVLRKKQTEYKSTAVDVKVAPLGWIDISTIGGQAVLPLGTDTITTFHFLNDVSKEEIAICRLNTAQNLVTSVQYKAVSVSPTASVSAAMTPNCFGQDAMFNLSGTPNTEVTYNINGGNSQTVMLDGNGTATVTIMNVAQDQTLNLILISYPNFFCFQSLNGSATIMASNLLPPTTAISPNPAAVCSGEQIMLNGNPMGGDGNFTHAWTGASAAFLSATNIVSPIFSPNAPGSYLFTYTGD